MIVRSFEVGEEQMPPVGRRSRELTEGEFPEITWEHSHVVVDDEGLVHTYCVYEAPSEEVMASALIAVAASGGVSHLYTRREQFDNEVRAVCINRICTSIA